jgi:formylglycine-generating enzyme required for sulfatase activity
MTVTTRTDEVEKESEGAKPIAVGSLGMANRFGLYDMHGNVWEWCEDEFHENYNGAPIDGRAWVSSGVAANRVFRGGGWFDDAVYCRSAYRCRDAPGFRYDDLGFRLSRTLP